MHTLRPFQKTGVDFLCTHQHALLADEMGLGKTVQAIKAADKLSARRILITCPTTVQINWARQFGEWSNMPRTFQILRTGKDVVTDADIVIVSYNLIWRDAIHAQLTHHDFTIGVCDEAHYLRGLDTERTIAMFGNPRENKKAIIRKCHYKYMMTGTPVLSRPRELYPMLKTLAYDSIREYPTFEKFALQFCDGHYDKYANKSIFNSDGYSNLKELNHRLSQFMLRRTKEEVLPELPPREIQIISLPNVNVDAVIQAEEQLTDDQRVRMMDMTLEYGESATLRRLTGLAKVPAILEVLADTLQKVEKIVVFTYHREVFNRLYQDYGNQMCGVIGGMDAKKKQEQVDEFITNPAKRIFLGQVQAAGEGLDGLQKVAHTVIFAELDWTPGVMKQAMDRVHRMGVSKPVFVRLLVAENTMEERLMLRAHGCKDHITTSLLDKGDKPRAIKKNTDMNICVGLEIPA